MPKYKYSNTVINKMRMMADETDKHRFGLTIRSDTLEPGGNRHYRARCYCKWHEDEWHPTRKMAKNMWEAHMLEAEKQGVVWDWEHAGGEGHRGNGPSSSG